MKDFVKMTLAVILGIVILIFAGFILGAGMLSSLALAGSTQPTMPKSFVLKIDMSEMSLGEQTLEQNPIPAVNGDKQKAVIGLHDAARALEAAADDPSVKYIYMRPDMASDGISSSYEFRQALARFRESGKAIVSYMDNVTTGGYYLASVSDKVFLTSHHGSTAMFYGISGQLFFLKDLFDKLGINMQLIRHGKYKSAGEMYVRSESSPENMEQNKAMISSIWKQYLSDMAKYRDITPEGLNALVDDLALNTPEDFYNAGLVDDLLTVEELKTKLTTLAVEESFKKVKMVSFPDYVAAKTAVRSHGSKKIAVIYADGNIVEGVDKKDVAGDRFAEIISRVRADSTIRAVVFRVNSPGGTVLAAEKIKAEIDLLKEQKPLLASFGNYAASGGYWISANSGTIYADPTTLTGSIGVFSMIPDLSGTMKNVAHVNFTPVNSNKHSDMLTMMRPLDAEETACMQASVEDIYERFVNVVAEGRKLDSDFVDSVAQGRVWTGAEALEIGLVDKLGTLEDAIKQAVFMASEDAEDVDVSKWCIEEYPKPLTSMEQILSMMGMDKGENILSGTPFEAFGAAVLEWTAAWKKHPQAVALARMPFDVVWSR